MNQCTICVFCDDNAAASGCFSLTYWPQEPIFKVQETFSMCSDLSQAQHVSGWWYTYPSEKYESQLGLLLAIYGKINMFQTTNQVLALISGTICFKSSWRDLVAAECSLIVGTHCCVISNPLEIASKSRSSFSVGWWYTYPL